MGSEDNLDYRGDEEELNPLLANMFSELQQEYDIDFSDVDFDIVSTEPWEFFFENGFRVFIRGTGFEFREPLAPISASDSDDREWGSKAFLDAGEAMFSGEE